MMAPISANMFHVKNFLCFFGLRAGTIFSLYFIFIFGFYSLLVVFTNTRLYSEGTNVPVILIEGIILTGVIVSFNALLYFPEINKKYDKNSVNAKCIVYFSIYNFLIAAIHFIGFFFGSFWMDRYNGELFAPMALLSAFTSGVIIHIAAVSYSFYRSILQLDNKSLDYEDMITNTNNSGMATLVPMRKNLEPAAPLLPPKAGECESSSSNNVYVELPL